MEAIRIATQTLLKKRDGGDNKCYDIVKEALEDLVKQAKAVELDQRGDLSGIATAAKDALLKSFRTSHCELMRFNLPLIEDKSNDQTLKFMTRVLNSDGNLREEAFARTLLDLAFEEERELSQKRVCGNTLENSFNELKVLRGFCIYLESDR